MVATKWLSTTTPTLTSQIESTLLLSALEGNTKKSTLLSFSTQGFQNDQVIRVLDANTVKLQKNGIVSLAGVRMPSPESSSFQYPDCFTYKPAYKLKQLIPNKTNVQVKLVGSKTPQSAILVRSEDSLFVNQEIIKTGFGRAQKVSNPELQKVISFDEFKALQDEAKEKGLGIFKRCEDGVTESSTAPFEAEFEPLELTVETQWGDDGGKQIVRKRKDDIQIPPDNPGDVKGCSDFATYEDSLRWFEYYWPYYGDVAKLDRDGDGVPCPGLPHTKVQDQYRMKIPKNTIVE